MVHTATLGACVQGGIPIWTSFPLHELSVTMACVQAVAQRIVYLGEKVVREKEYLSAMATEGFVVRQAQFSVDGNAAVLVVVVVVVVVAVGRRGWRDGARSERRAATRAPGYPELRCRRAKPGARLYPSSGLLDQRAKLQL